MLSELLLVVVILFLILITALLIKSLKPKKDIISDTVDNKLKNEKEIENVNVSEISEPELQRNEYEDHNVKISEFDINKFNKFEEFNKNDSKYSDDLKTGIESILHQAPNIAFSHGNINYLKVAFKPEVMKGIENGIYRTMNNNYAIAVNSDNNKIVGNAKILEDINPASIALAAWQILAIITAQKFLSDINKNLDEIKKEVEEVKDLIERIHYFGKIKGDLKYLREISNIILEGKLHPYDVISYNNQLENIDRDCLHLAESIDLGKSIQDLKNSNLKVKWSGGGSLEDKKEDLKKILEEFAKNNKIFLMSKYLRLNNIQLKCALPINKTICDFRIYEIEESILVNDKLNDEFNKIFNEKIYELESFFLSKESDSDAKSDLLEFRKKFYIEKQKMGNEIKTIIDQTKNNLQNYRKDIDKEISLVVELDNKNKINSLKRLLE